MEKRWIIEDQGNGTYELKEKSSFDPVAILQGSLVYGLVFIIIAALGALFYYVSESADKKAELMANQFEEKFVLPAKAPIHKLEISDSIHAYVSSNGKTYKDASGDEYNGPYIEFSLVDSSSYLSVDVSEYDYTRFTGTIVPCKSNRYDEDVTIRIYADDRCIYDSGRMNSSSQAKSIELDISGADILRFEALLDGQYYSSFETIVIVDPMMYAK